VTVITTEPGTRKCAGCGYRFRPVGSELYCCRRCQLPGARRWVHAGLERFAAVDNAARQAATGPTASPARSSPWPTNARPPRCPSGPLG